ncbi:MAG: hypothetical protein ACI9WS_003043 [Paraglaciecola psychrophila]|jgi:hypothetical protein
MLARPTYFNKISSKAHRRSHPKQLQQCDPMHIAASIVQILFILLFSITGAMKVWKHPHMRDQFKNLSYSLTYACYRHIRAYCHPAINNRVLAANLLNIRRKSYYRRNDWDRLFIFFIIVRNFLSPNLLSETSSR